MGFISDTSEIVESSKESNPYMGADDREKNHIMPIKGKHLIEADINRLIGAVDIRSVTRHRTSSQLLHKNSKKPMRVGVSQASGIGISEPVSLKQALRGLCISHASELATLKRLSKPSGSSNSSEAGNIKRLYRTVVVQATDNDETSILAHESSNVVENGSIVEISLVAEGYTVNPLEERDGSLQLSRQASLKQNNPSPRTLSPSISRLIKAKAPVHGKGEPVSLEPRRVVSAPSTPKSGLKGKQDSLSPSTSSSNNRSVTHHSDTGSSAPKSTCKVNNFNRRKGKQLSQVSTASVSSSSSIGTESKSVAEPCKRYCSPKSCNSKSPTCLRENEVCSKEREACPKVTETQKPKEKGECSQSSKSSIGEYSNTSGTSEESNTSGSSCHGTRPHMSKDSRWKAIHLIEKQHGGLGLRHFKLLKKLGCGDIGSVYLAELSGTECLYAMKVMDNDFLASRKKMLRAQTEREILQMLDHPFLPTLYAHFVTDKLSCLIMEYCPGGDLHVLRQLQTTRSFSEQSVRFYAAEVLLALEYLHMLGVVYRDLKPENVLVREDGHIMLSDFDLSLRSCTVNPTLCLSPPPPSATPSPTPKPTSPPSCLHPSCIDPLCLQSSSWAHISSCFIPQYHKPRRNPKSNSAKPTRNPKSNGPFPIKALPQLVAEPTSARSNSFVGTHEYLAPEIVKGEGHGSAVDWWTLGIFLYELLFGKTPFKGLDNRDTLANVVSQELILPENPGVSLRARDLIKGLLVKEPEKRLGFVRGTAEIKQHAFFEGLNWALIRWAPPPENSTVGDVWVTASSVVNESKVKSTVEFELF
ncbi:serine/threonine-protein kinase D6PK [Amborella trichopoda]|uniref:non-specific serine/threonine protein kinase n=1 Tax=Amborella trichopoda TaxID=13333 RepID=W1PZU0_AMBTC|nr:serine/threonine-protein kinase D6PK [Amborella trichopoda]XP_020527342.1 serine/threonine-protein kinase D6PK [Amborella trichopoda]ERN13130.1 hypothetical protein AMTR_s00040p00181290 [Amborella trichopoda]|eukprot:XP_006851549.1 serine/threonine-protein kinase D6PK [Amborella trichopoda]